MPNDCSRCLEQFADEQNASGADHTRARSTTEPDDEDAAGMVQHDAQQVRDEGDHARDALVWILLVGYMAEMRVELHRAEDENHRVQKDQRQPDGLHRMCAVLAGEICLFYTPSVSYQSTRVYLGSR